MWQKKYRFFGFLIYGLVTMGVIGVSLHSYPPSPPFFHFIMVDFLLAKCHEFVVQHQRVHVCGWIGLTKVVPILLLVLLYIDFTQRVVLLYCFTFNLVIFGYVTNMIFLTCILFCIFFVFFVC
jgi:hypothetical protein